MLSAHDRTNLLWGGHCGGCLEVVDPLIQGTREDAERELVARGWELVPPAQIRCLACSRRVREVPLPRNARGVRRRR